MRQRIPDTDPSSTLTRERVARAVLLCDTKTQFVTSHQFVPLYVSFTLLLCAILWTYWTGLASIINDDYS